MANGADFEAAKTFFASANLGGSGDFVSLLATLKQTHAILERGEALATPEGQQLGK